MHSGYNQSMPPLESNLQDTLHRIATRWWIHRGLETVGLSIVTGSVIGLILVPLVAWQGESSWKLSGGILGLSVFAGAIAGFRRRPGEMRSALEADRQWKMNDLLVSAAGMLSTTQREGVDPAMREIVFKLASADLATRRLSDLVLHRFSRRVWTGMGSVPVLLMLLTGICSHPLVLRAAAEARGEDRATAKASDDSRYAGRGTSSDQPRNSRQDAMAEEERPGTSSAGVRDARRQAPSTKSADLKGNTHGMTDDARMTDSRDSLIPPQRNSTGQAAGGNAMVASTTTGNGQGGRAVPPRVSSPPWERTHWPDQQTRALQSLEQSPPPASYRDLIHDYFSR